MFRSIPARILVLVLLLQAIGYYAVASRREVMPAATALANFPQSLPGWTMAREYPIEKEVQDVLRADDTLNRVYLNGADMQTASLFVAFFKTQRFGQSPHSPKNCMPGSGWEPTRDRKVYIPVPGAAAPIQVNDYVIQRENDQSVVLYWYQDHSRAIAGEIEAKFWLVADAIRFHRSDTALVRIMVPVRGNDIDGAERTAIAFTRAVYPDLMRQLPK